VEIAHLLQGSVNKVLAHDPVADIEEMRQIGLIPVVFEEGCKEADVILFLNNHRLYEKTDLPELIRQMRAPAIIFDGWKLFNTDDVLHSGPCIYMGLSFSASSIVR
jgi:UDP-N-acetyl-D-mannosaminuronate dehydrogenase